MVKAVSVITSKMAYSFLLIYSSLLFLKINTGGPMWHFPADIVTYENHHQVIADNHQQPFSFRYFVYNILFKYEDIMKK